MTTRFYSLSIFALILILAINLYLIHVNQLLLQDIQHENEMLQRTSDELMFLLETQPLSVPIPKQRILPPNILPFISNQSPGLINA